ncbi:MAG: cytochrome c biogenesis protein CcsA [Bacteroidota bacterium]
MHLGIGNAGHAFVVLAFISALLSAVYFMVATQTKDLEKERVWKRYGRISFWIHAGSVVGIVVTLFTIIANHYFEYHYAWSHASTTLPSEYQISAFWEGQEGSFLLWMFWHAVLGVILIRINRLWESSVMTVFALVQAFLSSMVLGVVFLGSFKLGSSPFILLRDALDIPMLQINPEFVPEEGNGLNPLLQNYWMVIHPPTLFLGFATTLVPFAYVIAGLWTKRYKEWIRPALPWALFSVAVLGVGILMGGYWAYETLNFGGYWNWDPVENAVYVPWLVLVAAIHVMIAFKKNETALRASIFLTIGVFVLILYSTFLTRSGILGDASVHSFTDLGLSGQLLAYLIFFTLISIGLVVWRWKSLPQSTEETSVYSREFWIFLGATVLCLMGLQVLVPTSYPVFNSIGLWFNQVLDLAANADSNVQYSTPQLWFSVCIAILSGTGQFFWWKKMDKKLAAKTILPPVMIALLLSALIILIAKVHNFSFIVLLTAAVYSIVANVMIMAKVLRTSPRLSGGAVAHIGIAMMLIGILWSAGYSKVVSKNNSGLLYSRDFSDRMNNENILLFQNETNDMVVSGENLQLSYLGPRVKLTDGSLVDKQKLGPTRDPFLLVAKEEVTTNREAVIPKGDTVRLKNPENTYHEVLYTKPNGREFLLYPRLQINETMGSLVPSPDVKRVWDRDLYTHITNMPDPDAEKEWSETDSSWLAIGNQFFLNDYVAVFRGMQQVSEIPGVRLREGDLAIQAEIEVFGQNPEAASNTLRPVYLIRDSRVRMIPDVNEGLGVKVSLMAIDPEQGRSLIGTNTTQKNWIILEAQEKPLINVLWLGTLVLVIGMGIAVFRRYSEFQKMRDKAQEV